MIIWTSSGDLRKPSENTSLPNITHSFSHRNAERMPQETLAKSGKKGEASSTLVV